jgi:hypothetical protein
LPLKWRRALKSVKAITINLLHEPTDHKSSILNKYQVELFSKRGSVDLLLNLDLISEFFFHQTPLVVQANF